MLGSKSAVSDDGSKVSKDSESHTKRVKCVGTAGTVGSMALPQLCLAMPAIHVLSQPGALRDDFMVALLRVAP
jgi:hypothetical protein